MQGAADLDALAAQLDEAQAQLEGGNAALLLRASFLIELLMADCRTPGQSQVAALPQCICSPYEHTFHMDLHDAVVWLQVCHSDSRQHTCLSLPRAHDSIVAVLLLLFHSLSNPVSLEAALSMRSSHC